MPHRHIVAALVAALSVSACQSLPDQAPPSLATPAAYPLSDARDQANAADQDWRSVFRDARLRALVDLALAENRDLRAALLDADAAKAQLRIQRASFLPQIQAAGGYARGGVAGPSEQASANLSMTAFEIDLFGRLRAQSASAFSSYLAAEEGARAARITVIATVADAYLAERAAAERLALAATTSRDWNISLERTEQLRAAGMASDLDLVQAQAQAQGGKADVDGALRAHQMALNALMLAVGAPTPDDLPAPMALADQPVLAELPAGLPAQLLERRPDVRQAEQRLEAAKADVRAARAAFFPQLSLTGQTGYASAELDDLFTGASRSWSFAPQLTLPIFQGGRLRGQHALAQARGQAALATYEKAIQTAFREVADGLAGRLTFTQQISAQQAAVGAARRRAELSDQRFRAGLDSRLELLDAQRSLYAAQQALVQLQQERASSGVNLYRALGGGLPRS
ncbi:efflux transporter, outer membrane factor lipoprotein, NodT family [Caulobacter sp. AP07]|uniref:efflux transporter outer membrane subunit n=1 Tax=Caulobacter sp. AP07 TaxID=1144304 RepID=UPI000271F2AB|nr:efflux transporter outer membrane subunit [Caulobacter sp. AP07]EJL30830.1 efflux transporter, outer membrane factor lipoprotein, NodT family [Caulobacter sp. AP07]